MDTQELIDTAQDGIEQKAMDTEGVVNDFRAESDAQADVSYTAEADNNDGTEEGDEDYESIIAEDLATLKREFSELKGINDITEIKNPLRYAALRDLGLTPTEAYLAARGKETRRDNRAHLCGTVPGAIGTPRGRIPYSELERAREIFYGMSDSEIQALYHRVTK